MGFASLSSWQRTGFEAEFVWRIFFCEGKRVSEEGVSE